MPKGSGTFVPFNPWILAGDQSQVRGHCFTCLSPCRMPTLEQRIQRLEDDAAIRDLAARFADTTTRANYAGAELAEASLWKGFT